MSTKGAAFIYEWHLGKEAREPAKNVLAAQPGCQADLGCHHMAWLYCGTTRMSSFFCKLFLTPPQPSRSSGLRLPMTVDDDGGMIGQHWSAATLNADWIQRCLKCWRDKLQPKKEEDEQWAEREVGGGAQQHIFLDSHLFTHRLPASTLSLLHRCFNWIHLLPSLNSLCKRANPCCWLEDFNSYTTFLVDQCFLSVA